MPSGPSLPPGVPPPPLGGGRGGAGEDGTFKDFMDAFRTEMRDVRSKHARVDAFIPSAHLERQAEQRIERRANDIFGVGPSMDPAGDDSNADSDDYDYW